ncbi:MAG: PTS system mannose/fructose/sorbose family transporter subunit IID [Oscillospiraceae bacterium]|nr:PTS system mannose/fructose/sorbose family transporter subunit IID [Oscillospiraceae bacterium]
MHATFTFGEALIVGIFYYLAYCEISLPFIGAGIQDASTIGLLIGLAYGDATTGIIIGASIAMMYISNVAVGANLPSDGVLAACVTVPIAIHYGLDATTAVAFAIPFGVLGPFVDNFRRLINGVWNRTARTHVQKKEYNKLWIDAILGPSVVSALFRIVPLTLLLWLFGDAAGNLISGIPAWLNNGLSCIGALLPGLGLILCVNFMGKRELVPFFLIGFYFCSIGKFSVVFAGILGLLLAFFYVIFTGYKYEDEDESEIEEIEGEKKSPYGPNAAFKSKGQLIGWGLKFCATFRMSQCMDYFYGTGIGYNMMAPLKRVYKNDEEGYQRAIERHLQPFITNPSWGAALVTGSIAMEEDIAENGDDDGTKAQAIETYKTSLMGPLAGIGDSFEGGIMMPIFKAISYPLALAGSWLGCFPYTLWFAWMTVVAIVMDVLGYEKGRSGIVAMINKPIIKKVLSGAGVLGVTMMGALASSYVSLNLKIAWATSVGTTDLVAIMNNLIPSFFTVAFLGICYLLFNKGVSYIKILLGVVAFGLLAGLVGIV